VNFVKYWKQFTPKSSGEKGIKKKREKRKMPRRKNISMSATVGCPGHDPLQRHTK